MDNETQSLPLQEEIKNDNDPIKELKQARKIAIIALFVNIAIAVATITGFTILMQINWQIVENKSTGTPALVFMVLGILFSLFAPIINVKKDPLIASINTRSI